MGPSQAVFCSFRALQSDFSLQNKSTAGVFFVVSGRNKGYLTLQNERAAGEIFCRIRALQRDFTFQIEHRRRFFFRFHEATGTTGIFTLQNERRRRVMQDSDAIS